MVGLIVGAVIGGGAVWWGRRGPQAPTEIFAGITYGCDRLDATEEGGGLVHWVSIDLTAPGIELYVTPLDPAAVAQGWQYRLRRIADVVDREQLAVAINAALLKWGIGGQRVWLRDGTVWAGADRAPDSRTAVAIDGPRRLLFLAVGQNISPRRLLQKLADLGAKDGMLLDGGGSSSMAIGKDAAGVSAGVLYGGWRPVATYFGVRARPVR
jgi:hypothetical protein